MKDDGKANIQLYVSFVHSDDDTMYLAFKFTRAGLTFGEKFLVSRPMAAEYARQILKNAGSEHAWDE